MSEQTEDTAALDAFFSGFALEDCLAPAANMSRQAQEAKQAKNYNVAWVLLQDVKALYLKHAQQCRFTTAQTLALDASVSQAMADILRLERKHDDALVHILYWVGSTSPPTKSQIAKMGAYLRRSSVAYVSHGEINELLSMFRGQPDFLTLRDAVASWRVRGDA